MSPFMSSRKGRKFSSLFVFFLMFAGVLFGVFTTPVVAFEVIIENWDGFPTGYPDERNGTSIYWELLVII